MRSTKEEELEEEEMEVSNGDYNINFCKTYKNMITSQGYRRPQATERPKL